MAEGDGRLTQKMMTQLYDVSVSAINQHLKKVFSDSGLDEASVIKKYLITASDGKDYNTKHYNLQAIIAVGFKVNNDHAVQFHKWANGILKDYTIQGWAIDDVRLKNGGSVLTKEYFDHLLEAAGNCQEGNGKAAAQQGLPLITGGKIMRGILSASDSPHR